MRKNISSPINLVSSNTLNNKIIKSGSKTHSIMHNTTKKDELLSTIVNIGSVILFIAIVVIIYLIFFNKQKIINTFENFESDDKLLAKLYLVPNPSSNTWSLSWSPPTTIVPSTTTTQLPNETRDNKTVSNETASNESVSNETRSNETASNETRSNKTGSNKTGSNDTIYETSLKSLYSENKRLICSMLPSINNTTCTINKISYVIYNFPVHMIKLFDGSILAVFNDGRLYKKTDIFNTMWAGPLKNSLPNDNIPIRMISLSTDLTTLLCVGYDNKLYMKKPDSNGLVNLVAPWQLVPNNINIIYVLFDNETGNMISININGELLIKTSLDITSNNIELLNKLDRPILRMYYDLNGYVLVIDNKFELFQFSELNWKNSVLNLDRGSNNSKIQDILYHNDGKLFGLIFNPDSYMVQIMKQSQAFYLGDFTPLEKHINLNNTNTNTNEFVMSDQDIIKSKNGNIQSYINNQLIVNDADDDPNIAYQKQIIETRANIKQYCTNRNIISSTNYDNYDLLANVEKNDDKIIKLKDIANKLITYEPNKQQLLDKYTILNT